MGNSFLLHEAGKVLLARIYLAVLLAPRYREAGNGLRKIVASGRPQVPLDRDVKNPEVFCMTSKPSPESGVEVKIDSVSDFMGDPSAETSVEVAHRIATAKKAGRFKLGGEGDGEPVDADEADGLAGRPRPRGEGAIEK
jgi:hypothetical protein